MNSTLTAGGAQALRKSARPAKLWLITLGHALTHWYPATFYLLLPIIGNELGLSFSQIGLIMTCQYIAGAVANVPGGVLVDTVGRKGLLMGVVAVLGRLPVPADELHPQLPDAAGLRGAGGRGQQPVAPDGDPDPGAPLPRAQGLVLSACTAWAATPATRSRRWSWARCWRC